jgi:hypothetical protein
MLTDLHLHKYLEGRLSDKESDEVEKMLAKNPDMQARLEVLKNQSQVLKPTWQRVLTERSTRRGSRTRYTTLLPALLMLMVVLMVTRHWFARPGENSTFTMNDGNGTSLELLYNSKFGWRYLDAEFRPSDSLSISIRDTGTYHVSVMAIYGHGPDAEVRPILLDGADKTFAKSSAKPVFLIGTGDSTGLDSHSQTLTPSQIMVFYDDIALPPLDRSTVLDILTTHGNERGGLNFQYQVFSAGR